MKGEIREELTKVSLLHPGIAQPAAVEFFADVQNGNPGGTKTKEVRR